MDTLGEQSECSICCNSSYWQCLLGLPCACFAWCHATGRCWLLASKVAQGNRCCLIAHHAWQPALEQRSAAVLDTHALKVCCATCNWRSNDPNPHAPPLTLLPVAALCLSPDGRGVPEAHVKLPTELLGAFPEPAGDDARFLQEIAQRGSLDSQ